jgi:hypothetical protein
MSLGAGAFPSLVSGQAQVSRLGVRLLALLLLGLG